MTRDSIHISMSEPLRRAQVRPRLQSIADATGLPLALVGARALTIGLGHIEGDLRLIFTAAAAPSLPTVARGSDAASPAAPSSTPVVLDAIPITPALCNEPLSTTATADAQPSTTASEIAPPSTTAPADAPPGTTAPTDASPSTTAPPTDAPHTPIAPTLAKPSSLGAPVEIERAPRANRPARVSTQDAARALKITTAALQARIHRSPELRNHAQRDGRKAMWDLPQLRQALAK